jgi:hypothetical protein
VREEAVPIHEGLEPPSTEDDLDSGGLGLSQIFAVKIFGRTKY